MGLQKFGTGTVIANEEEEDVSTKTAASADWTPQDSAELAEESKS